MLTHEHFLEAEAAGLVSRRSTDGMSVFNYTSECAYSRNWTPVTRAARGVIVRDDDGQILARPFDKFFNLGEMPETEPDALPATTPVVTEKLDGSLGIIFWTGERWRVSTRGSLESEQAVYADQKMLPRHPISADENLTLMVEVIYPDNRVVVDYGDRDEMVLLAARHRVTGEEVNRSELRHLATSVRMALRIEKPFDGLHDLHHAENTEGYVFHWPADGLRVKVKSPEYVQAHRLLGMVNPKRVIEMMADGSLDDVRGLVPEWTRAELDQVVAEILAQQNHMERQAHAIFDESRHLLNDSRKAFALGTADADPEVRTLLFALADGRELGQLIRKLLLKRL